MPAEDLTVLDPTCTGPSPSIISLDPMLNIGRKKLGTITKHRSPILISYFSLETYRCKRQERQKSMAHRRCLHRLRCQAAALLSLKTPTPSICSPISFKTLEPIQHLSHISSKLGLSWSTPCHHSRHFCSNRDHDEDEDSETGGSSDEEEDDDIVPELQREYTLEEKEAEAAEIGYKVVGPLQKSDGVFKPYEPVFAIVQIGSHQFKVSNGDSIFTERLKFCELNDKLILNKVLLLGSQSQTIIGRPIVPDATVYAVVEEHALDAKVIIFKKKRRKNYRRTKGHRQELTKLRIIDIQGIEKPEKEKVEVAA